MLIESVFENCFLQDAIPICGNEFSNTLWGISQEWLVFSMERGIFMYPVSEVFPRAVQYLTARRFCFGEKKSNYYLCVLSQSASAFHSVSGEAVLP